MSWEKDILLNDDELSLEIGAVSGMNLGTGFLQPIFLCGGMSEDAGLELTGLRRTEYRRRGDVIYRERAPRAVCGASAGGSRHRHRQRSVNNASFYPYRPDYMPPPITSRCKAPGI